MSLGTIESVHICTVLATGGVTAGSIRAEVDRLAGPSRSLAA